MSKKNIFLILTIIFFVFDIVLALVVFKPSVFKLSRLGEEPFLKPAKEEKQIKVAEDKSGVTLLVNSETVGRYEKFEISFKNGKTYDNPFNPEEVEVNAYFITPSGKEEVWPGFWYQDYSSRAETSTYTNRHGETVTETKNIYTPVGEPFWMFRYAPIETGEYKYSLTIEEGNGAKMRYPQSGYLKFSAISSNSKGYVEVSRKDSDYFTYSNGETFFPVGHGPEMSEEKLRNFAQHKMNIVQAEFSPGFKDGLNGGKLGQYDLEKAFIFDGLLGQAEDSGIYTQMGALVGWPEFSDDNSQMGGNSHWDENPYNKKNGGILDYPLQFDSNEQAKKYFSNRVRYMIARWGYSTNVFCWQLWGEYDMRLVVASEENKKYYSEEALINWHREMSDYIKTLDKRHLVSTAEAFGPNERIWNLPSLDFAVIHDYDQPIDWNLPKKVELYKNLGMKKPILVQEYGPEYLLGIANLSEAANQLGYHNPLWQTVLMKLVGAPMKWTWYDDPREQTMNLDEHYQILADFFKGEDLANWGIDVIEPLDLSAKQNIEPIIRQKKTGETVVVREGGYISPVKMYALGNYRTAYLWLHDLRNSLSEVQNTDYTPQVMQNIKFQLNNLTDAKYQVEFIDTWNGLVIEKKEIQSNSGSLVVDVPQFTRDIAVKVKY